MSASLVVRLPVSGRPVALRPLNGSDELALADAGGDALGAALELLARIAEPADDGPADWGGLVVTDFESLLLDLRRRLYGEVVRSDFDCPRQGCGERVEIEFRLADLMAAAAPRRPRGMTAEPDEGGWRRLDGVAFRLPSISDVRMARAVGGAQTLQQRCIRPAGAPARAVRRAELAMEALAPEISRTVAGACPACGSLLQAQFDAPGFVVAEIRRAVGRVADEVDLIASDYHWSEPQILALPSARRQDYAERIRARRRAY